MYKLQRSIAMALTLVFLATPCLAADTSLKSFFEDCLYGGLSGGLVGAAVMAFTKKPSKHFDYIGYGAAAGVLAGATYGTIMATRSLAEYDHGTVHFSMPTIRPEIREANSKGQTSIVATAELIRGRF
ncbi:hypothetical protein GMLC_01840 [Geomonas limicola]|uniref:Glycine zipper 2TM domain-containing protein n=1 Tax=Geomonas limicola TaxID=2740186 RepID=A0A6V8N272_9BACT|nr:hypothetical protein [Geomonas limicola]GFO66605.1 hypothetical protein GMLC_01840 [Geomonas limicola]